MKQRINLLPTPKEVIKQRWTFTQLMLCSGFIVILFTVITLWFDKHLQKKDAELLGYADKEQMQQEEIQRLEAELAKQTPDSFLVTKRANLRHSMDQRAQLVKLLAQIERNEQHGFATDMQMLAELTPNQLWFTEFSVVGFNHLITLKGHAKNPDAVPLLMKKLSAESHFGALTFSRLEAARTESGLYSFSVLGQRIGGERD